MDDRLVPGTDQILGWIDAIFSKGIRRPGYPADRWVEDFALETFREMGLEHVRPEPVSLQKWEPRSWSLQVTGAGGDMEIPCFPLPHSAPTDGLEAELVPFDPTAAETVRGKAALDDVRMMVIPSAGPVTGGPEWDAANADSILELSSGGRLIDPRGTLEHSRQVLPLPGRIQKMMEPVIEAGAVMYIGSLSNYPGDGYRYYVPYDAVARPIPGVWIRGSDGARLKALLNQGPVYVWLRVDSGRQPVTCRNIIGELPGADEQTIVIGSHHDGPWSSAVEDASGVALVLAQAAYWSGVPAADRPHRMIFLLNAGHMAGGAGCHAFISDHAGTLDQIVLAIHLEHAASEFVERNGGLVPTGEPEPRWFFTSRITELEDALERILIAEKIDRALIIHPDTIGPQPTTDGGRFHTAGVPLVDYLTAPFYLFDPIDTMDKIHVPSLVPVTRATIQLAEWSKGRSAADMRAAMAPGDH